MIEPAAVGNRTLGTALSVVLLTSWSKVAGDAVLFVAVEEVAELGGTICSWLGCGE